MAEEEAMQRQVEMRWGEIVNTARRDMEKRASDKQDRQNRKFYKAVETIIQNGMNFDYLELQYIGLLDPDHTSFPVYSEQQKQDLRDRLYEYVDIFMEAILDNRKLVFPVDQVYQRDQRSFADISLL